MPPAFHSMVVHLLTGLFFAAAIAVVARLFLQWRGTDESSPLAVASDYAGWFTGMAGLLFSVGGFGTGFFIWGLEASVNSPVIRNKILASLVLLLTWGLFSWLRGRYGPQLWRNVPLALFYTFLALIGNHWILVTNSIGGDVAGVPSGYEAIPQLTGVETRFTYYLPTWMIATMIVVAIGLVVFALMDRRRGSATDEEPDLAESADRA